MNANLSIVFPMDMKGVQQVVVAGGSGHFGGPRARFQDLNHVILEILILKVDERLKTTLLRQNNEKLT